jgi:chemotaxis protein CheD
MNHYLLPYWAGSERSSPRFGNVAIQGLVDGLISLGSTPHTMKARVVGGACVIAAFRKAGKHLGLTNVDVATRLLGELGVPIVTTDIGGDRGRKVTFQTDNGLLHVRTV